MRQMFSIGIVGLGSMGHNHVRVLKRMKNAELVGYFDPVSEIQGLRRFSSLEELSANNIDYCVVASPTRTHTEVALKLISQGISLLIEKPISDSLLGASDIREASNTNSVEIGVGHIERFNNAIQAAKALLNQGTFGEILAIDTLRKGPKPSRNLGVGVVLDLMSHDIDTTLWLTGANYTETSNFMLDRGGNNLEDYAVVQSLLSSGAIVRHQVDWLSPTKIRETRILCANGMIIADTVNTTVKTIQRIDGKSFETLFHADPGALEPLELQHLEFQKLLEKKYSAIATLDDGIKVIEIISSIFK